MAIPATATTIPTVGSLRRRKGDCTIANLIGVAGRPWRPAILRAGMIAQGRILSDSRLMDEPVKLDLSGLKCPLPALRTRKALIALPAGARLRVICTDPLAGIDIPHLVREEGDRLEAQVRNGDAYTFVIRRASPDRT